ncbi:MAG: LCP family protein [Clostridia bacterium]|nr:LCP family protein [Clostridia bacterium]
MERNKKRILIVFSVLVAFALFYCIASHRQVPSYMEFGHWENTEKENRRTFLVLGTDKEETRTDLILLCQYNEKNNHLSVLQIPRDTRVENGRGDKKINSAYGSKNGIKTLKNEVEKVTGIYPDNYFVINFKGFRQLIDAIGGVEFDVPVDMKYTDPVQNLVIDIDKGYQTLDGKKAEMFMRFRQNDDHSGYAEGDIGRLKAHKSFYRATIDKLLSFNGVFNIGEIIDVARDNVKTDFTLSDLFRYMGDIRKLNENSVEIVMLPGRGEYISDGGNSVSFYITDTNELEKLKDKYF